MSRTTVYVDVSDLLRHSFRTGIQRVVRQVVTRLVAWSDDELGITMVRFDPSQHDYVELDTTSMLSVLEGSSGEPVAVRRRDLSDFRAGEVFFDVDSAWNSPLKRSTLYPRLKQAGVTIVSYVYDLVPLKVPDVVHETTSANWIVYLSAVLAWSDLVMTDSRSAERDFLALKRELDVQRHIPTVVTRLGCDLPAVADPTPDELALLEPFVDQPFVLFVGTIEPRKQHLVAVQAFDPILTEYPDAHLVLAGRKGWIEDDTIATITEHPAFGDRLHWIEWPSDGLLAELYHRATICLYLSRYEGFGLPIAEALAHGRVTVASRGSGMTEVGGDASDYTWHNLAPEITETLGQYLGDPELLGAREKHIREQFRPLSWDTVASTVDIVLRGLSRAAARLAATPPDVRPQLVVLGMDPAALERAVTRWATYRDVVREIVVVAPEPVLNGLLAGPTDAPVVPVPMGRVMSDGATWLGSGTGVSRRLLARLAELPELDNVFVLTDETHLPLDGIDAGVFVSEAGRMAAYHFQDLTRWSLREDGFDDNLRAAASALGPRGFELLGYAVHQPQVIDKELLREALVWADAHAPETACGLSTYFNHAVTRHPTRFEKRAFRTLNWPVTGTLWAMTEPADDAMFEAHDPTSYATGVFRGLAAVGDLDSKLYRKRQQLAPFVRSRELASRNLRLLRRNNLAHGPIRFSGGDITLLAAGLPQLITVVAGSDLTLEVAYQVLDQSTRPYEVGLAYRVDGGPPRATVLRRRDGLASGYETGTCWLPIRGDAPGLHDVEFFLLLDGRLVRARHLRYLAKLVVVGRGERPAPYYDALADQVSRPGFTS